MYYSSTHLVSIFRNNNDSVCFFLLRATQAAASTCFLTFLLLLFIPQQVTAGFTLCLKRVPLQTSSNVLSCRMPVLRQSDTTHNTVWRGHSHKPLLISTGIYLCCQFLGEKDPVWHTSLKGKSNYHKYVLDTHDKNRQNLACVVVVKQVANNTASGSPGVLAWKE